MRRLPLPGLLVALLLGLSISLTACGGDSSSKDVATADKSATPTSEASGPDVSELSAEELLVKAKAAITGNRTVTVTGTGKDGTNTIGLDLTYVGKDASGSVSIGAGKMRLLSAGGRTWFKASDAFWRAQVGAKAKTVISVVDGRWILAPRNEPQLAELIGIAERKFITETILDPDGTVEKGSAKEVSGVDCVALTNGDGVLYLDKRDARPVELQSGGGSKPARLSFGYESKAAPKAPASKDQIDLAALAG